MEWIVTILVGVLSSSLVGAINVFAWSKIAKKQDRHETERTELLCSVLEMERANMALGEAVAIAVRDKKCNGEMAAALEYAKTVRHKQEDLIRTQVASNF